MIPHSRTTRYSRDLKYFEEVRLLNILLLQKILGITSEVRQIGNFTWNTEDLITSSFEYDSLKESYIKRLPTEHLELYRVFEEILVTANEDNNSMKTKRVLNHITVHKLKLLEQIKQVLHIENRFVFIFEMRKILLSALDKLILPRTLIVTSSQVIFTEITTSQETLELEDNLEQLLERYFEDFKQYIVGFKDLVLSSTFFHDFREQWESLNPGLIPTTILKENVSEFWRKYSRQEGTVSVTKSDYKSTPNDLKREGVGYSTNKMLRKWAEELATIIKEHGISTQKEVKEVKFKNITTCVIDQLSIMDLSNVTKINLTNLSKRIYPTKNMRYDLFRKIFGVGPGMEVDSSELQVKKGKKIQNGTKYKITRVAVNNYIRNLEKDIPSKRVTGLCTQLFRGNTSLFYFEKDRDGFWLKRDTTK